MGEFDENILPASATPLPIRFRKAGYWTFNEGGKDDYNFTFDIKEFYNFERSRGGWGPASFVAGDCLKGKPEGQPFFGQIQLGGGKLDHFIESPETHSTGSAEHHEAGRGNERRATGRSRHRRHRESLPAEPGGETETVGMDHLVVLQMLGNDPPVVEHALFESFVP